MTVKNGQRLAIEDVESGRILALLPENVGRPVTFSPDGQLVAATVLQPKRDPSEYPRIQGMKLIESASGQEVAGIKTGEGCPFAFSRAGRLLAIVDKDAIHIWDFASGSEFFRRPWPKEIVPDPNFPSPACSLAFLPDGRRVVAGMRNGEVLIWDVPLRPKPILPRRGETLEALWTALAGEARKAHTAIYALTATPATTVPFLAEHLKPAAGTDAKLLTRLLADLDSEQFAVREAAQRDLTQFSDDIEPKLRRLLESKPSLEVRRRLEAILASPRAVPSAATLRTLRAIRVLEMIGTTEARQLLRKLSDGAGTARETREAAAALASLDKRDSNSAGKRD